MDTNVPIRPHDLDARPLRVFILHPDLGVGGAERLVVDAALELQARGHRVTIVTGRHDPARSFDETCHGAIDVRVRGGWLPVHVAGRLRAPLTIARMTLGALDILRDGERPDAILCDVAPHVIPLLRAVRPGCPVLFYCHFPDRLLTPARHGAYAGYRAPIDAVEAAGTAHASRVIVNSRFTAEAFARAYPAIATRPEVLYPGVDTDAWMPIATTAPRTQIVSVARFERTKNVTLAVHAFAALRARITGRQFRPLRLVLAGGFDPALPECQTTLAELRALIDASGLDGVVDIRLSPSAPELHALVAGALAVVHTAEHEHFGYVPIEAMSAGRPVVAVASGGPRETITDDTGFLVAPTADSFAEALHAMLRDPAGADRKGAAGRRRVMTHFSRDAFGAALDVVMRGAVRDAVARR